MALLGAQAVGRLGFETMIFDLIRSGGDTDTNASMAGQVAGTLLGYDSLPLHLVERVPHLRELVIVAKSLTDARARSND